ncbi:MAG TPA: hypothetical protein VHV75_18335 [Solirubrobacteraceae bacterium]|nr:hypothetical protein [Solirubrobacteraceae bacterium]
MSRKPPLERPADIYGPFTAAERTTLMTFVADVRRLGKMRFFDQVPRSASLNWGAEGPQATMDEPDDEAVRAVVSAFRQIYASDEPTSAARTLSILKRSVRARSGADQADALEAIRDLKMWLNEILDYGIGMGISFDDGQHQDRVDAKRILDTYFHGKYLHSGNAKAALARRLDNLEPWPRYTLYRVMWKLARAYWIIANVAEFALLTPEPAADQLEQAA